MKIALITGSAGLVGSESVRFLADKFDHILGVDNDLRAYFFGPEASTMKNRLQLQQQVPNYIHYNIDLRDNAILEHLFKEFSGDIDLIIHTAGQPSHDWAAKDPHTDFSVNANATLNLLELTRHYCPQATFIFTSTNKVYGDRPNALPFIELPTRWELPADHPYYEGIDIDMSIDQSLHSLFGVSKVAADTLVQEYGRYFGIKTAVFRCGCLTGPCHCGTQLHGFLHYLIKSCLEGKEYTILGYKGKQVRDNIHAWDLVNAFWHFYQNPKAAAVYNIGGSRHSNCSVLEAIEICERISGCKGKWRYRDQARRGDHIWWISDIRRFKRDYPQWNYRYDIEMIIADIIDELRRNGNTPCTGMPEPT